ncbi:MAG TPA: GC-type dockerin domain-anchored protein [Phycisphaerales bacterium]|nr:GC-type dockerin domain-anchored protein [Phycisphaerales bacterium]
MIRHIGLGCVVAAASVAAGQTSELYINQYDNRGMVVVQGGGVVRSWDTVNPGETALAVADTVRTAGNYWFGNNATGAEYNLSGSPLGPTYTIIGGGNWFDGATDGRFNYAVQHNGDYNLYRFDREWGSPEVLFNVGFATSGITVDPKNGTFWVSDSLSRLVRNLDQSGNELSSFLADDGSYAYGLAMDPVDGTLWVGGFGSNVIYQYDANGDLLSSVAVPGIGSAFGMEFAVAAGECLADFNGDGIVDTRDVLAFLNAWNNDDAASDCDGNGVIDTRDVICFLNAWTAGC